MDITIRNTQGDERCSISINTGAKGYCELMKHDYVVLPFSSVSPVAFAVGDYADLRGLFDESMGGKLSKVYKYISLQAPTFNTSTGGYDYELRLDAYYYEWNHKIFKYLPESHGQEASWSLTAPLDVHMGVFLRNLKARGYKYSGVDYGFTIDTSVGSEPLALTYSNVKLVDALTQMAEAAECEWWVTDNIIHFGKCEDGTSVKIELNVEASDMTRNDSKGTYATRIYAFGGDRNIPSDYRPVDEQTVVSGVVQKRLMLPVSSPYVDAKENMSESDIIEAVVMFDEVYPRRVGEMQDVQTVDRKLDSDEDENATFKAYQYRDNGLTFDSKYILDGKDLQITFCSGKLNGKTFGVTFNPDGKNPEEQLFEIVANEDYGRRLPDDMLYPENNDKYVLFGFDIRLISDQYVSEAEQELLTKAKEYVAKACIDDGTYAVTLRSDYVYTDQSAHTYDVGQKVGLVNPSFFNGVRESRVLGWEMNLDFPFDSPVYMVGESAQYSRLEDVESKVGELTYKGQVYAGGSGVYIVRLNDITPASDSNVLSALRSLKTFLRKDTPDSTSYLLKLLGGMEFSQALKSAGAVDSLLSGKGVYAEAESGRLQVDRLEVRDSMTVMQLIINKLQGMESDFTFSPTARIESVEKIGEDTYRLTIGKKTEFDTLPFSENNILYEIVNSIPKGGTDYYTSWMRVVSVNANDFTVTVVLYTDDAVPGGKNLPPVAGYNVSRRGDSHIPSNDEARNADAQSWLLSSDEGRIMFLQNVFKPMLEDYSYALTIGKFPEIKALDKLPVSKDDVGIMAQTVIAEKFYQYDYNGDIVTSKPDRGAWSAETAAGDSPYRMITHESITASGKEVTKLEQHVVHHLGCTWACLTDKTQKEPRWNSPDWEFTNGDDNYMVSIESSNGVVFSSMIDTDLTLSVTYSKMDITALLRQSQGSGFDWSRDTGDVPADNAWSPSYVTEGDKTAIHIDGSNAHGVGTGFGYDYRGVTFRCRVFIPVGDDTVQATAEFGVRI